MNLTNLTIASACVAGLLVVENASAQNFVDFGGPAEGYIAVSNFKNSSTQNGIEGLNGDGSFNPGHNGLPEYPNYQLANGNFTAVISSPLSADSDFSDFADFPVGFGGTSFQVNNQTITQPDFATLSAGRIDFDNSLVTGVGTETVGVADLVFDFNTFEWDGTITPEQTGDSRSNFSTTPVNISPLSPVYTPFNDGSGAGNAQLYHLISIDNVTGNGLTFQDGELVSMDFVGDLTIDSVVAPFPTFGSLTYVGTFTGSGLDYAFDVSGTDTLSFFSGVNLVANRAGTASLVIPEPASIGLFALGGTALIRRRR